MSFLSSSQGQKFDGIVSKVDCGTQTCDSVFEVLETCLVYLEPDTPTSTCMIPCDVSGCIVKTYHFINCAVWTCQDKVTTTLPPVTSSTPSPAQPHSCSGPVCISSVSLNFLVGTGALVALGLWSRKTWQRRRRALYQSLDPSPGPFHPTAPPSEPAPTDAEGFQEVPLIPRAENPAAREQIPLKCFDSFKKFWSRGQAEAETQF